jgi:hypothetical protein
MPEKSDNIIAKFNFNVPRFKQISEAHCGPAVIQMLLSNLGVEVTQEQVAVSGEAAERIELHGMRVDQLALAASRLAPDLQFWYKVRSSLEELISLIVDYHYPVGVEWQGLFEGSDDEDDDDSETGDDDYGHYSIITHVNRDKQQFIIADPYKTYISQARVFTWQEFEQRWWDFNEITDPSTGQEKLVEDFHMMFIITPKEEAFPRELGMIPYSM